MTISSVGTGSDDIAVHRDTGQSNRVGVVIVAEVDLGAHLPLIDFGTPASLPGLKAYAQNAARLGYRYLCANDHLLFGEPSGNPRSAAARKDACRYRHPVGWPPRGRRGPGIVGPRLCGGRRLLRRAVATLR
jgi:hypothetical protein